MKLRSIFQLDIRIAASSKGASIRGRNVRINVIWNKEMEIRNQVKGRERTSHAQIAHARSEKDSAPISKLLKRLWAILFSRREMKRCHFAFRFSRALVASVSSWRVASDITSHCGIQQPNGWDRSARESHFNPTDWISRGIRPTRSFGAIFRLDCKFYDKFSFSPFLSRRILVCAVLPFRNTKFGISVEVWATFNENGLYNDTN